MPNYTHISSNSLGLAKKDFAIKKTRNPPHGGSGQLFTQGIHANEIQQNFGTDHGKSMSNIIGQKTYQDMGSSQSFIANSSTQQLPAAASTDGNGGSALAVRQKTGPGGQRSNKGSSGGPPLPGQQRRKMSRGALASSGKRLVNNSGTYNAQTLQLDSGAMQQQLSQDQ